MKSPSTTAGSKTQNSPETASFLSRLCACFFSKKPKVGLLDNELEMGDTLEKGQTIQKPK